MTHLNQTRPKIFKFYQPNTVITHSDRNVLSLKTIEKLCFFLLLKLELIFLYRFAG